MIIIIRETDITILHSSFSILHSIKEVVQMQKKIPQRQCMGCRERKAKRELIRVVRNP